MRLAAGLRYGEHPHQPAAAYLDASLAEVGRGGIGTAIQHHGKEARAVGTAEVYASIWQHGKSV